MNQKEFTFLIASPFDKEKLICEIYYGEEIVAEISQENNELIIEIYPSKCEEWWSFSLLQFQSAVENAKQILLKG